MRYLQVALLTTLLYHAANARCQKRLNWPNPAMAALQNILGPGTNERIMQLVQRRNRNPLETVVPTNPLTTLPNMRVIQPKCSCQSEQAFPIIPEIPWMQNQQYIPNMPPGMTISLPMPEVLMPTPLLPSPELFMTSMPVIQNTPEIVMPMLQNIPDIITMPRAILPPIMESLECPCASPRPLVSPFLPAASPVSAWAPPTSSLLPPVQPKDGRSNYLRKIPIPPPTL